MMLFDNAGEDFVDAALFHQQFVLNAIEMAGDEVLGHAAMAFAPGVVDGALLGIGGEEIVGDYVNDPDFRLVAAGNTQAIKKSGIRNGGKIGRDNDVRDSYRCFSVTSRHEGLALRR